MSFKDPRGTIRDLPRDFITRVSTPIRFVIIKPISLLIIAEIVHRNNILYDKE